MNFKKWTQSATLGAHWRCIWLIIFSYGWCSYVCHIVDSFDLISPWLGGWKCVRPQSPLNESQHQLCSQPPRWSHFHIIISLSFQSSMESFMVTSCQQWFNPPTHIFTCSPHCSPCQGEQLTKRNWIRITPLTDHILCWLAGCWIFQHC